MSYVIKIIGLPDGKLLSFSGEYVKFFDFEYLNGLGRIDTTKNLKEAKIFKDFEEAINFYNTQPICQPYRNDGKPNKPMSAATVEFIKV